MKKVLVAYASKHLATAEIAQAIGRVLTENGLEVDVKDVNITNNVTMYDAVVLGSAVYTGNWMRPMVDFLKRNIDDLTKRDVWLFSSGPSGKGKPSDLLKGWKFPENLKDEADYIVPRDIAVFHGRLEPSDLNLVERVMINAVKAPTGDYRDWDAIHNWAQYIADVLVPVQEG